MKGASMDRLYIVIPAYNEEANIEKVIKEWHEVALKYGSDSRLVVVNDGSKDNTLPLLHGLKEKYERLRVLDKPNGGHGSAVTHGYKYALRKGADYIFQTDSDGQTDPSEFGDFWKRRKKYAMVIGERSGRQDGFSRVVVTKTLKLVILAIFHVNVKDANTPFRLMKPEALEKCLELFEDDYNLPNVIISTAMKKWKYPVCYRHITFRPRQGGVNSINIKKIVKIGIKALKDFRTISKRM